jgi:hypothetical protein
MSEEKKVATTCAVGEREGQVILTFPEPVQWAAFDPETAKQIGIQMAKSSYEAVYGKAPAGNAISQEIRAKLVVRTQHVIRSMQEKNKAPEFIAMEVVDTILAEIL